MTVALVLATATACDLASRPAIAASPPRAAAAGGSGGPPRDAAAQTGQNVRAPTGGAAGEMAASLPLPSLHGGHVAMEPLLARLCGQLRTLGTSDIYVITPPGRGSALAAIAWEGISNAGDGLGRDPPLIQVVECASVAAELRAAAAVVRSVGGSDEAILLCAGDMVAHTEALARLKRSLTTTTLAAGLGAVRLPADPDLRPALRLAGPGQDANGRGASSRRTSRAGEHGRPARRKVVAAGSAFHRVHAPNAAGCGAVLVSAADQDELASVADELAILAGQQAPPGAAREAGQRGGFTDSCALLLVGLVRSGVHVEALDTGPLTCVRVSSPGQATDAAAKLHAVDEDKVRLDDAVSPAGIVATFLVNPYSRFIARWAARRRLTPDAVTGMSIGLGLLAAVWFSLGSRAGLILGAALFSGSFVLGCTDGQLARYSRQGSTFRAWLDRFSGRVVEYAVYAGLAAGVESATGPAGLAASGWIAALQRPSVWQLAIAAVMLQSVRDMIGFSAGARARRTAESAWPPPLPLDEPADYAMPSRVIAGRDHAQAGRLAVWMRTQARRMRRFGRGVMTWTARIIEFGPGERVAVICVAAVAAGARMAFLVLLAWGLVSVCLTTMGQLVRSFRRGAPGGRGLVAYRDDGFIAQSFGRFVEGQLPPLLPAVAGVTVATVLSVVGANGFAGAMVLAPVVAMALAGLGSANPHDGRLDWLVPPALQFGQFVFLAALALAGHVPSPVTFSLVAVIALHYYDIVYRALPAVTGEDAEGAAEAFTGMPTTLEWLSRAGLGWDGRMLVAGLGAVSGANTATFALLSVYLWMLFGWESLTGWIGVLRSERAARGDLGRLPAAAGTPSGFGDGGR